MSIIPKPPFPNVPKLPGVPQLPRSPNFPAGIPPIIQLPVALGSLWLSFVQPQWGIYDNDGNLVLQPDSIVAFGNKREYQTPTFRVENGGFAAYNKVQMPREITVRVTKSGGVTDREAFLLALDALVASLNLFRVVTPEDVYINLSLDRYEINRRGAQGAYWLPEVDLFFREIRQVSVEYVTDTTQSVTANAQQPSAQPSQSQGQVQPQTTLSRVATQVRAKLTSILR